MTDIVERLRRGVLTHQERRSTELEAADEIERLYKVNELLRHDRNMIMGLYERQNERVIWLQEQLEELQKEKT